jgi:hypothetical protein
VSGGYDSGGLPWTACAPIELMLAAVMARSRSVGSRMVPGQSSTASSRGRLGFDTTYCTTGRVSFSPASAGRSPTAKVCVRSWSLSIW